MAELSLLRSAKFLVDDPDRKLFGFLHGVIISASGSCPDPRLKCPRRRADQQRGMTVRLVRITHRAGLLPVASMCGLRAAMTVNRVATRASPPYPRAICGSEKVLESWPAMR